MASVSESAEFSASADDVWGIVGDPAAIAQWHPALASSSVEDGIRSCALEGGGDLTETIVEHSDEGRSYAYDITAGPFPIASCRAKISVEEAGDGSRMTWQSEFEPEDPAAEAELSETMAGIYKAGFDGVRGKL